MSKERPPVCLRCKKLTQVFGCRWCSECWYPGIDEEYNEYQALLSDGHSRINAQVLSGWMGIEEVNGEKQ